MCCSRPPVFATPSARAGINEELFSPTYQALHHCIGVVCTVQRFHGLGNLCHVLTDTSSVLQADSQARVVRGQTFKLIDLPLGLPERVFCTHAQIVPRWLTRPGRCSDLPATPRPMSAGDVAPLMPNVRAKPTVEADAG